MVTKNIRLSSYALLITLALSACTDGPTITPQTMQDGEVVIDLGVTDLGILDMRSDMEMQPQGESVLRAGAMDLQYVEALNTLRVFHDEHHRFDLPLSGLMMGTVDEVGVDTNYDPYHIYDDNVSTTPEGLVWHPVVGASVSVEEGAAVVALEFESLPAGELRLTQSDEQRLTARISAPEGPIAFVRIRAGVSDTEAFYGLGEVFDDVNHRGKLRAMQLEFDGTIESANNEAHVPIPVLYGHTGWGLFVESLRPAIFDVAQSDDESIDAVFGTGTATAEGLQFHIFTESHPLDLTRHYYELTGYPKLPAQWAYGPWIWRDENEDEAQIRSDIQIIRDLDLATSGYWVDRPYASAVNSFDWDPRMFDDPQGMIDFIHSMGFRFALWHAPYIGVDDVGDELTEATLPLRETAEAEGYYPPSTGALTSKWGRLVDLTNPEAYAWWQALIRRYSDMGVEGYKLDYGEDIVPGYFRLRSQWEFFDGSNDQTMHARYQTLFHQVYAETLPETGGFLLCRAATWGGQTNGIIIWPGDLNANFAAHRELVTDGDRQYVAVGGLGPSVIAGLSLGPSGFPFYGSDTGGYRRSPPTKEVFTRWFQQTALSSVMQVGTNTNEVAWEFSDETGFDQEMLDWYRIYTRLHMRLFPYAWAYATDIAETGRPILRPYGWQYPEGGIHPSDVYFFGDDLLVAPVLTADTVTKEVPFPEGQWVDWWTGELFEGGETQLVDAPLSKLPLYIRAGAIIPMLRPNIDTLSPTTVDGIESYADDPGRLYVRIVPGPPHQFTLHDGTELAHDNMNGALILSSTAGTVFPENRQYEVFGVATEPTDVRYDDTALTQSESLEALSTSEDGWFYDESQKTIFIRAPGTANVTVLGLED